MNDRDREKAFEKTLRRTLRQRPPAAITNCPEPDLLAAYFDHSLSAEETTHWELHFSTCSRCQEILNAVAAEELQPAEHLHVAALAAPAAATPPPSSDFAQAAALRRQTVPSRSHPLLNWRWFAPAAAVAAAFVLWFSLRPAPTTEQARLSSDRVATIPVRPADETPSTLQGKLPAGTVTKSDPEKNSDPLVAQNSSGAALSDSAQRSDQHEIRGSLRESSKTSEFTRVKPESPAPSSESGPLAARASSEPTRAEHDQLVLEKTARAQASAGVSQHPGTQPAVAAKPNEKQEAASKSSEQAKTVQPTPSPKPLLDLNAEESRKKDLDVVAVTPAPSPGTPAEWAFRATQADSSHRNLALRLLPSQQVSAPGSTVLWRFGPGGLIERSLDAGQSWGSQASPVTTELLAGSSPAENVCWIVGRAGAILRTTDGEHWEKISSPAEKDWISVVARSALAATITSRDSHRYSTTDGGRTWSRQ